MPLNTAYDWETRKVELDAMLASKEGESGVMHQLQLDIKRLLFNMETNCEVMMDITNPKSIRRRDFDWRSSDEFKQNEIDYNLEKTKLHKNLSSLESLAHYMLGKGLSLKEVSHYSTEHMATLDKIKNTINLSRKAGYISNEDFELRKIASNIAELYNSHLSSEIKRSGS